MHEHVYHISDEITVTVFGHLFICCGTRPSVDEACALGQGASQRLFAARQPVLSHLGAFSGIFVVEFVGRGCAVEMSSKDGGDGGSWHVDDAAAELDSKAEMPVDSAAAEHREEASEEYDPLRDGPARYLGYANEVGESFRPRFPRFVGPSYAISWSYVVADCYDKGVKAHVSLRCSACGGSTCAREPNSCVLPHRSLHRLCVEP